jgi:hypothetical protein
MAGRATLQERLVSVNALKGRRYQKQRQRGFRL